MVAKGRGSEREGRHAEKGNVERIVAERMRENEEQRKDREREGRVSEEVARERGRNGKSA